MTKTGFFNQGARRTPVMSAVAAAVVAAVFTAPSAQAVEISTEKWSGSFDSTFTAGASWRVEDRDASKIGKSTNNRQYINPANRFFYPAGTPVAGGVPAAENIVGSWSTNNDDGNLNFDQGETFSRVIKGLHELDLKHEDGYGIFLRGTWLYDAELMDETRPHRPLSQPALDRHGKDARFLDAYVFWSTDIGESPFQMRLGEQVVNWGESALIQHSISEANALDASKLRVPGSELKEAFIPTKMLWGSLQLTESIGLEAYYQFEFEKFIIDSPGTYFGTQDFIGDNRVEESSSPCFGTLGFIHLGFGQFTEENPTTQACRLADRTASDDGQFGLRFNYLTEDFTELSFYYLNYHNKRPIISAYAHNGSRVEGFIEYLEDISLYGVSFNMSTDAGWSIAGEVSYRQDEPLQIDDVEILFKTLEPVGAIIAGPYGSQIPGAPGLGEEISGYRLFDTYQAQVTFTKLFTNFMGADQFAFLAEVGANWIQDMPDPDELRFEVAGTVRSGNALRTNGAQPDGWNVPVNPATGACFSPSVNLAAISPGLFGGCEGVETNEFATDFSAGYRLVGRWDFYDAFAGVNVSPRLVFSHHVEGYTPAPISNFMEDRMGATVGVSFDYLNRWRFDVSYVSYFGNDEQDPLSDRDFISAFVSYSL